MADAKTAKSEVTLHSIIHHSVADTNCLSTDSYTDLLNFQKCLH